MPNALGTPPRIDNVDLLTLVDRIVRTFWLTDVAVDTFIRDH